MKLEVGSTVYDTLGEFHTGTILFLNKNADYCIIGSYCNDEGFTMEYERKLSEISFEQVQEVGFSLF